MSRGPKNYDAMKAIVLHEANYLCQICRKAEATEADHIWPKSLGGPDELENLQAACGPCNKKKGDRVDIAAASMQELLWYQNHQNRVAIKAEADADRTRGWVAAYAAGLMGRPYWKVYDVPENERRDESDPVAQTLTTVARWQWTGASFGWINAEQIAKTAASVREDAVETCAKILAECAAAESVAAEMVKAGSDTLHAFVLRERNQPDLGVAEIFDMFFGDSDVPA